MDIYCAARSGDLERVKYLCEVEDVDINKKNDFDSIPLFYACLCGHAEIVEYLLDRGAKVDSNSFEGERCYYAALTRHITDLLISYKAKATINPITEKLKIALKNSLFADFTFKFSESLHIFKVHRFILVAKCEYFAEMFRGKWRYREQFIFKSSLVKPEAFKALVEYLYTNTFNIAVEHTDNFVSYVIIIDMVSFDNRLLRLCRQCRLHDIHSLVLREYEELSRTSAWSSIPSSSSSPSFPPSSSSTSSSSRKGMARIVVDRNIYASPENFATSANLAYDIYTQVRPMLDATLRSALDAENATDAEKTQCAQEESHAQQLAHDLFTDTCLVVEGLRFHAHRVFLCAQSEYFRSMLAGGFRESSIADGSGEIVIPDVAARTFYHVLEYVYTNFVRDLDQDLVLDLLCVADQLLMLNLKNLCARQIVRFVDCTNVVEFLEISDLYNSTRLREFCEDLIELNLDVMMNSDELNEYLRKGEGLSVPLLKEKIKDKLNP